MPEMEVKQSSTNAQTVQVSGANGNELNNNGSIRDIIVADVTPHSQPLFADDEKKMNKMQELRNLVENHDDIVRRSDDLFLCRFLNCCDWDVDQAYERMYKIFKLKQDHQDWFITKPLAHYKRLLDQNIKVVLDKRDKNGRRIFVTKLGKLNINTMAATDVSHLDELWVEYMLNDLETQEKGISCLIDMSGYSIKSMRYLTPTNIKVGMQRADLMPLKHMEFHVVNSSVFLNAALAIVYPVLSKHFKDHVHFHYRNWDSLHACLGKEALPAEYGGTYGAELDYDQLNKQLWDLEEHFDSLIRFGCELKPKIDSTMCADSPQKTKNGKKKNKSKDQGQIGVKV
ncbi:alpha-tocopherol transfer protein-like [Toxorhynchites rutilus septentrionalis]|uniref:alpha-tocopherol transfer protein-like n=1 Tax=Toxorhynchites rutilus septentrionalis TaxID=329112 RepID=UPI00247AB14A|nr:alpha-tocopherol transfer protein-like [Toxorhynchites rutilus septentrionalis]